MDGVIDRGAAFLQHIGQLLDLVLGLGQGHAVAGHDDHVLGGLERLCGVLGFRLFRRRLGRRGGRRARCELDQVAHGLGGVAQHHDYAGLGVKRVVHTGVAGLFIIVADDHGLGLVRFQNGHAVNGGAFGGVGRRVDHVVGAHHHDQIGVREHGIDRVHFQQVLVIHIGFGQKHVHVAGHAARHGMNGVIDLGASGFQGVGQLFDLVLGLGQGHAVAGHNDHVLGRGQQAGGLGGGIRNARFGRSGGRGSGSLSGSVTGQRAHGLGRVAQQHVHAGLGVKRVGHPGVAGLFIIVADDHGLGLVRFQNGHAVNGGAFGGVGRRVDHVVGAHHHDQIGVREHGIDRVHFQQVLVIHIGFGQKHVHVAGHAARHGMNGVIDLGASGFQGVGQLFDLVLGLGQGHAVAGHNDHVLGRGQQLGDFSVLLRGGLSGLRGLGGLGRGRFGGGCRPDAGFAGHGGLAQQDGHQLAVHGLAHDAGEHQTGGTHNAAHGDEQRVGHGETGDGAGNAAHGVEQGNGDGHVRAAHPDGEDDAEQRAGGEHHKDEEPGKERRRNVVNAQGNEHDAQQDVDDTAVVGEHDGPLRQQLVQFARRHKGARDGRHARAESETGVNAMECGGRAHVRQHDQAHQGRGAAAEAVQEGHQLGHLDHLDLVGQEQAEGRAQCYRHPEGRRAERIVLVHGDENGAGHGRGAENIAAHGRLDVAHQVQAVQDGQSKYGGNDVVK